MRTKQNWWRRELLWALFMAVFLSASQAVAQVDEGEGDVEEVEVPVDPCGDCVELKDVKEYTAPSGTVVKFRSNHNPPAGVVWAKVCTKDGKTIVKPDRGAPVTIDVAAGDKVEVKGENGQPASADVVINSNGNEVTVNNDQKTTINGNGNTVTSTTNGGQVTVSGNNNTVGSTNTGGSVTVSGNSNNVTSTQTGGTVSVSGTGNTITSTANGGTVNVSGSGNTVSNQNGGANPTNYVFPSQNPPTNTYSTQPGESNPVYGSFIPG